MKTIDEIMKDIRKIKNSTNIEADIKSAYEDFEFLKVNLIVIKIGKCYEYESDYQKANGAHFVAWSFIPIDPYFTNLIDHDSPQVHTIYKENKDKTFDVIDSYIKGSKAIINNRIFDIKKDKELIAEIHKASDWDMDLNQDTFEVNEKIIAKYQDKKEAGVKNG